MYEGFAANQSAISWYPAHNVLQCIIPIWGSVVVVVSSESVDSRPSASSVVAYQSSRQSLSKFALGSVPRRQFMYYCSDLSPRIIFQVSKNFILLLFCLRITPPYPWT